MWGSTNIYSVFSLPGSILSDFYQSSQNVIQKPVLICKLLPVCDRISSICQNVNQGTIFFCHWKLLLGKNVSKLHSEFSNLVDLHPGACPLSCHGQVTNNSWTCLQWSTNHTLGRLYTISFKEVNELKLRKMWGRIFLILRLVISSVLCQQQENYAILKTFVKWFKFLSF